MQFPGTSGLSLVYSQRQRSLFQSYGSQEEFKRTTHTNIFSEIFPTSFLWFAFFLHPVGKTCSSTWESFFRTFGRSKKNGLKPSILSISFKNPSPFWLLFNAQQPFFVASQGFFAIPLHPKKPMRSEPSVGCFNCFSLFISNQSSKPSIIPIGKWWEGTLPDRCLSPLKRAPLKGDWDPINIHVI